MAVVTPFASTFVDRLPRKTVMIASDLTRATSHVRAVSPAATLARGYALVQDQAGTLVRDSADVSVGQPLDLRLATGRLSVDVTRTMPAPLNPPAQPSQDQAGAREAAGRQGRTS